MARRVAERLQIISDVHAVNVLVQQVEHPRSCARANDAKVARDAESAATLSLLIGSQRRARFTNNFTVVPDLPCRLGWEMLQ